MVCTGPGDSGERTHVMNVLIAVRDSAVRTLLTTAIAADGHAEMSTVLYTFVIATTAGEVQAIVATHAIACVVMDYAMATGTAGVVDALVLALPQQLPTVTLHARHDGYPSYWYALIPCIVGVLYRSPLLT